MSFPRLYAAASLKLVGLGRDRLPPRRFPRLYAAASLKLVGRLGGRRARRGFPRLYAAASLKPHRGEAVPRAGCEFSAALCRGLIEASPYDLHIRMLLCFPRLYAAASLKPAPGVDQGEVRRGFSAALCRGLIEAFELIAGASVAYAGFPRGIIY